MGEISPERAAQLLREIRQGAVAEVRRAKGRGPTWARMADQLQEEVAAYDRAIAAVDTDLMMNLGG